MGVDRSLVEGRTRTLIAGKLGSTNCLCVGISSKFFKRESRAKGVRTRPKHFPGKVEPMSSCVRSLNLGTNVCSSTKSGAYKSVCSSSTGKMNSNLCKRRRRSVSLCLGR